MDDDRITPERIDELLQFLPALDRPGRSFVKNWVAGEDPETGTLRFPFPVYSEDVLDFFACVGQPWWRDYSYDPTDAGKMLADDNRVRNATLEELRTMLTYCMRGERFCDGHWESLLQTGRIVAILRRLAELRDSERRRS